MKKKWVYLLQRSRQGRGLCRQLGQGAGPARRQGSGPGRHDPDRCAGAARLHGHYRRLQRLSGGRREAPRRFVGAGTRRPWPNRAGHRQGLRRSDASPAGILPVGCEVLDARDDGHGPQPRPQRERRRGPDQAHRRCAVCVRPLPPPGADVRQRGPGRSRRRFRGGHHGASSQGRRGNPTPSSARKTGARLPRSSGRSFVPSPGTTSPTIPSNSCVSRPKRSSNRGTASAPSPTATPPTSRTTSAPPSTSRPWCSAIWAPTAPPASPCRAMPPAASPSRKATI